MDSTLQLIGLSTLLFIAAFAMGFVVTRAKSGMKRTTSVLNAGDLVRVKTETSMYRTRLAGQLGRELHFEGPLSRDAYVPLRVGEPVTIEASTDKGIMVFQGFVEERDETNHRFMIKSPETWSIIDRRDGKRRRFSAPQPIEVDGQEGAMVDISEKGARIVCVREFAKGERIHIESTSLGNALAAWIIEATPKGRGAETTNEYRVVFEEPAPV